MIVDDDKSEKKRNQARAKRKANEAAGWNQGGTNAVYEANKKLKKEIVSAKSNLLKANEEKAALQRQLEMVTKTMEESKSSTTIVNPIQLRFHEGASSIAEINALEQTLKTALANGQTIRRDQIMSATARDNINWAIAMGTGLTNEEIEGLDSTDFLAKLREVFPRDTSVWHQNSSAWSRKSDPAR